MRVFVTGIGGFVGPVLARALAAAGHEVHGLARSIDKARARLGGADVVLHVGDVGDATSVERALAAAKPEGAVHLAAVTFVPEAERDPAAAYRVNVGGTLTLLGALRAQAPGARLLAIASSDIYGRVDPARLPIDEDTPFRPTTVYGASKAAVDVMAGQWGRSYDLDVVRARPFNHTGPGQDGAFVCSAIARQLAMIEGGRQEPVVRVGNVDAVRDFSDVRDIVAGYIALLERGRRGEAYNLCSGDGVSIAEVIALLRSHTRVPVRVHSDPTLRRANDVPRFVGSHARATADTGWRPNIPLTDTLAALLDDWRTRLTSEG